MKKVSILLFVFILTFLLTGCTDDKKDGENSTKLDKTTTKIVKANIDNDGNIIIKESDITDKVVYINYEYEGVIIGLLAVKDSNENVKVVINTCQSCGGSPHAYFVQLGGKIQCQNCGNIFDIDSLDILVENGCNPIAVEDKKTKDGNIIVGTKQLKKLKTKFENWEGPKV